MKQTSSELGFVIPSENTDQMNGSENNKNIDKDVHVDEKWTDVVKRKSKYPAVVVKKL